MNCLHASVAASILVAAMAAYAEELKTVVVTANRSERPIDTTLSDVVVIDRETIEAESTSTLAQLLRRHGGIEIAETGGLGRTTGLFVRGTRNSQSVVLIDGLRLENPSSGGANLEFLPVSAIERVEIVKGPAASIYGSGAIGGVIQVFTRRHANAWSIGAGAGDHDVARAQASLMRDFGDTSLQASIAAERGPRFETTSPANPSYQADLDSSRARNARVHLAHKLGERVRLSLGALATRGEADFDSAFSPSADTRMRFATRAVSASAQVRVTDRWLATLRGGRSHIDYTFVPFVFAPRTSSTNFIWENTVAVDAGEFLFGAEDLRQTMVGDGVSTGAFPYSASRRSTRSLFGGYSWSKGPHLARIDLRNDRVGALPSRTTGMLAYGYRFGAGWLARASMGTAFRAPTFDDLYSPFGSNPSLRPERARSGEVALERRWSLGVARAQVFASRIDDAIELDAFFVPQNVSRARVTGVSTDVATTIGPWRLDAAATFQRARAYSVDPVSGLEQSRPLARRASRHASVGVHFLTGAWQAGARVKAQSERFEASGDRMGGYAVIDADFRYRIGKHVDLDLKVGNLADRRYETAAFYPALGRSFYLGVRVRND
ncbi:MAG: TonB-dependent receptor [Burkholderiaceae bacterium]